MKKQANTSKSGDRLGKNLLLTGAAMAAAMLGGNAAAQQTGAATAPSASSDEEIVVTGTRITRPGTVSASPIASVGEAELQIQEPSTVETVIRQLPQFVAGDGGQVNNGSSGAATVDLRGLSPSRTLVLVDGHRMPGFDPNGVFDIDTVPLSLLRRIDVVTGGASAVYGSDAVAGVVNFILNDTFEGVQFDYTRSQRMEAPYGDTNTYWMTLGANLADGRGNVVLAIGHSDRQAVNQVIPPGSSTPGASSNANPPIIIRSTTPGTGAQFAANGDIVPVYQKFDFNPYNYFQSPQERWTATAIANYQITPEIEAYSRFIFSDIQAQTQLAPTLTNGRNFEVPLNNPFLTAQASSFLSSHFTPAPCSTPAAGSCVTIPIFWRAVQEGPRATTFRFDTFQILGGFRGDLGDTWHWDVNAAHGEGQQSRQQRNDVDANRIQQALFASDASNCFDASNGCAPLNIFNATQPTSAASLAFVALNLQLQSNVTQDYVTATANGEVPPLRSPFATTPLALAFGAEYRSESAAFEPDAASASGASAGYGPTTPTRGHYDVMEVFGEGMLPLIENAPLAEELNLEFGYRISDYTTSGRAETYKYGAAWIPFHGLRVRGMYQQAIRSANIFELFTPRTPGTGNLVADPCAAGTPGTPIPSASFLYNLCAATGVPVALLNGGTVPQPNQGQINNFASGNPDLEPETAHTLTYGFVWQPDMIEGLTLTADYYNIKIDNAIGVRPISDILAGCYDQTRNPTGDPNNADCLLAHRNPLTGDFSGDLIYGVEQGNLNLSEVQVEGVDIGFNYERDLGWGTLNFAFDGTHLLKSAYSPAVGAPLVDCVGLYGSVCGLPNVITVSQNGPTSENRWIQRTTLSMGPIDISYRWRHLSAVRLDGQTAADPPSDRIDAFDYIDVAGVWRITDAIRMTLGITNVTNKEAPFVLTGTGSTPTNSGNTFPSTYDTLGRVVSFGVSARF